MALEDKKIIPQELQALIANRIFGSSDFIPRSELVNDSIKKFLIGKLYIFQLKI
jgi:hypothetical protein